MSHDHGGGSCESEEVHDYDQALSIGSVFVVLAASLLGTVLPLLFKRYPRLLVYPFAVVIGKHIGTGVLLSLAFIHLLVPAFAQLESECLPESWHEYPFAPLFALLAALAMHLIETAVLEYTVYSKPGYGEVTHTPANVPVTPSLKTDENDSPTVTLDDNAVDTPASRSKTLGCNGDADLRYQDPASLKAELKAAQAQAKVAGYHSTDDVVVAISQDDVVKPQSNGHTHAHHDAHGHSHGILLGSSAERTIGAYILEFGLTSHSIIVGITLGVAARHEQTSLLPALAFHQFFEGFALGARLASIGFGGWNEAALTAVYSLSAPLGIAIGVGIVHSYHPGSVTALLVQGIFDSISSGIILYVAFVQMLGLEFPADYKSCGRNLLKKAGLFGGLYVGVAVMAIIGLWL